MQSNEELPALNVSTTIFEKITRRNSSLSNSEHDFEIKSISNKPECE